MKKLTKILGVALTFVLATSLIILAAPAMADDEEWAAYGIPDEADAESIHGGFMQDTIDGLGPFVQASDGTLYLYISGGVFDNLYSSDDWGRTWEATDWDDDTGQVPVDIWPSSDDSDILYAVSADTVWKTDDAGDDWTDLGDPRTTPATEDLTCITVGYANGDPHVFVGSEDTVAPYGEVYYFNDSAFASLWTSLDVGVGSDNDCNVYGIAVSPFFDDDTAVVALINEVGVGGYTATNTGAKVGAVNWDTSALTDDQLVGVDQEVVGGTDPIFVEDFDIDDNYELFVGVDGDFHNVSGLGGVFRMTGTGDLDDYLVPDVDDDIFSLGLVGDMGSTSLIAGGYSASGSPPVYYSTNDGDDWDEADTPPSAETGDASYAFVILDEDFADSGMALCASDVDDEGGVHSTMDFGATWQGISALGTDMDNVYDVSFTLGFGEGDAPMFMITDEHSLWRYDSSNWERMLYDDNNDIDLVEASPFFPDDNALFIADSDVPMIWRSTDGAATFDALTRNPGGDINAWLVLDDETVITADDATSDIYKTTRYGRRVWDDIDVGGSTITDLARSPDYNSDGTLLAGDEESLVFISTDEGEEWDELGDGDIADDVTAIDHTYVAFDSRYPDTPFVYAGSDDAVERCEIDTSADWGDHEWDEFTVPALGSGAGDGISGIACSDDGMQIGVHEATLYVLDAEETEDDDNAGGLRRCLNPADDDVDDAMFETVRAGLTDEDEDFSSMVEADRNLHLTYGSNILFAIDTDTMTLYYYVDTLATPVVLSSPSDGAGIDSTSAVTLEWDELNGDLYEVQVNVDDGFPGSSDQGLPDNADGDYVWNSYSQGVGDTPDSGEEYYWRVRVHEGEPVLSRWSSEWQFQMKVGAPGAPVGVRPLPGAQDIVLSPSFSWASISGADLYEFELSTDPDFTDVVTSGTAEGPVFVSDVELDYGTTYYWRIRGLAFSGAPQGDWNVSVFTTMMEPEEAQPPVIVKEGDKPADLPDIILTVPDTETPVYVWIIIAIGALLVVAMIILIVRTRAQPR